MAVYRWYGVLDVDLGLQCLFFGVKFLFFSLLIPFCYFPTKKDKHRQCWREQLLRFIHLLSDSICFSAHRNKEPKVTYDFFTVSLKKHFWNIITLFFILISEGRLSCTSIMQSLRIPVCRIQSMECLLLLNHVLSLWWDSADLNLFLWGLCSDYWFIQSCIYLHLSSTDNLYFDKP